MRLNLLQSCSLKTRVTMGTLAIFLMSIWALSFYASQILRKDMARLLGEQQFSTVSILATSINAELQERFAVLEKVAEIISPAVLGDQVALQILLEQRPALRNLFNGGYIAYDHQATAIADVPFSAERIGLNYMDIDSIAIALREGRATVSSPVIGKKLLAPVFGITVPIRDIFGKVIGALAGVTNLGEANFLDKVMDGRYGKRGGYLLIAPQQRLVVSSTDKLRIMESLPVAAIDPLLDRFIGGYEGTGVIVNPQGVEVLASNKRLPVTGWIMVAVLPTEEAFAPIQEMLQHIMIATIFLTLLAGGLTWWLLRRQLVPLFDTARTLATFSAATQPWQPLPVVRQDEIGQLIGSFNQLLESLAQHEFALRESEAFGTAILNSVSSHIAVLDAEGVIVAVNQKWRNFALENSAETGTPARRTEIGTSYLLICETSIDPANALALSEAKLVRDGILQVLSGAAAIFLHDYPCHSPTEQRWFTMMVTPLTAQTHGAVVVHTDITKRKLAEENLQLAASVFTHAREGILITAADGLIIDVNEAFSRITGYARADVIGKNPRLLGSGRQDAAFYRALWQALIEHGHWYGEIWNRRKNGEVFATMQTISAIRDAAGDTRQYVALFSDITALKEHENALEHIAHYDALTGLPNRLLLADRLHQAMVQTQRHERKLAVVYLDLDGFKAVNDHHGHEAGDHLLITLAARMKEVLREGDTLARIGGDEFVGILLDLTAPGDSVPTLTRLLAAAADPVPFGGEVLQVSASLGVSFYPAPDKSSPGLAVDAVQLLRQADQAMYQAKLAGKNCYHFFGAE